MTRRVFASGQRGAGKGYTVTDRAGIVINARFDDETFGELRAYAIKKRVSVSEAIRVFVEIGMEQWKIAAMD